MDRKPYPIVADRVLEPVPTRRFFGRPQRGPGEVPVPSTGHLLVYRTRGEHVLDDKAMPLDSPKVVDASHVSVVDATRDTEVVVQLTIPSLDASYFTLRVTFLCTVEDPVAVVRAGWTDAESLLTGYLRGHQRIFEVGLDFGIDRINDVRRKINAQVRAYVTLSPPEFTGLAVDLASVEVNTPEELVKFQGALREEHQKHTVDTERLQNTQRRSDIEQSHKQSQEVEEDVHTRRRESARREHALDAVERTTETAGDPQRALALAYAAGEMTAKDYWEAVNQLRQQEITQDREDWRVRDEHRREQDKVRWEAERADQAQDAELKREELRLKYEAEMRRLEIEAEHRRREHETHLKELDFGHDQARTKWEAERADQVRTAEWERENRQLDREATVKEIEAKLDVIRELAKHGHLDTVNLRLDRFVNDMLGNQGTPALEADGGQRQAIASPAEPPSDESDDNEDAEPDDGDDGNTKVEE